MKKKKAFNVRYPKQRAEQIIKNHYTQREIKRLREKWNIPQDGIKVNEDSEKWQAWFDKSNDNYLDSAQHLKEESELKQKLQTLSYEQYPYKEREADQNRLASKIPINEYGNDLLVLRQQLELSDYWDTFIEHYLKFNTIEGLIGNNSAIHTIINAKTGEYEVYLRIWEHTRIQDIKAMWSQVRFHQQRILGFKKIFRDSDPRIIDRNLYIYNLHQSGDKVSDIADSVYKKYAKEDTEYTKEEEKIYLMTEEAIMKVISRIK